MKNTEQPQTELYEIEDRLKLARTSTERLDLYVDLVRTSFRLKMHAKTKNYVLKALILAKRLKSIKDEAYLYYIAGATLINLSQNTEALEYLKKALAICQQADNNILTSDILGAIGFVYGLIGDFNRALEYQRASIEKAENNIVSLNNIGYAYSYLKEYDKALEYLWKGHNLALKTNVTEVALTTLVNIASNYYNLNDYEIAQKHFETAIMEAHDKQHHMHEVFASTGLSKVYIALGDKQKALHYILLAEKIANKKIHNQNSLMECYNTLIASFEAFEDYEKAYLYMQRYLECRRQCYTEELTQKLSSIQVNFELEKQDIETMRAIEKNSRLATIGIIAEGILSDIGNPLNAIKIAAGSILYWNKHNPGFLPAIITNVVHNISDSTKRMDVLIEHMKQFWKDPDDSTEEKFDLHDAIDNTLLLIASRIASHGIDLELSSTKQSLTITGKQIYLEQVIINLIFNSIQALDGHTSKHKIIRISSSKKGNMAYIRVQDSGPGISHEMRNKLFEPFSTTKNRAENMGLGLAIVKQIVDRFAGTISINNTDQEELAITIGVPLS